MCSNLPTGTETFIHPPHGVNSPYDTSGADVLACALPTGFKPVEKKEKRKSSLFPLWT